MRVRAVAGATLVLAAMLTACAPSAAPPTLPTPQTATTPKFEKVYVPLVEGLTVDEAIVKLEKKDLVVEVDGEADGSGIVTCQSIAYEMVVRGSPSR